jgi:tRNA A37 threonylcarbamoyladenosine biosynthesis protein TsaE
MIKDAIIENATKKLINLNSNLRCKKSVINIDGPDGCGKDSLISGIITLFGSDEKKYDIADTYHIPEFSLIFEDVYQNLYEEKDLDDYELNDYVKFKQYYCNYFLEENDNLWNQNKMDDINILSLFNQQAYNLSSYQVYMFLLKDAYFFKYAPYDTSVDIYKYGKIYLMNRSLSSLFVYSSLNLFKFSQLFDSYDKDKDKIRELSMINCMLYPQIDSFHIYLYADAETLSRRNQKTMKKHVYDTNLEYFDYVLKEYDYYYNTLTNIYKPDENYFRIDTTNMNADDVFEEFENIYHSKMES